VGADAIDKLRESLRGDLLFSIAKGAQGPGFGRRDPILVINRDGFETFSGAEFFDGLINHFTLVDFARADDEPDGAPGKRLQFLGQFRERFRYGLRGRGAFLAEKVAVAHPNRLARAEEWEGLQGCADAGE